MWNPIPSENTPPKFAIGDISQIYGGANGNVSSTSVQAPRGMAWDGTYFYVVSSFQNRVLVYEGIPSDFKTEAKFVLGQPNFTSSAENSGGSTASNTLSSPNGIAVSNGKLAVADAANHRVLIWNLPITANQQAANLVLGQPNFTSNELACGSDQVLSGPTDVKFSGTKLIVSDSGNDRVLIWNTVPTGNQQPADTLVGQSAMNSCNSGNGLNGLFGPSGVEVVNNKLVVADSENHRVLIYNTIPAANNASANVIIGQSDAFQACPNACGVVSAKTLSQPEGLASDGTALFIADRQNYRVLKFSSLPTSNFAAADIVLGQPSPNTSQSGLSYTNRRNLTNPVQAILAEDKLLVVDSDDNRVLIWNRVPYQSGAPADVVLGQESFQSIDAFHPAGIPSASNFGAGTSLAYCDGKLLAVDFAGSRVLVWNSIPTEDFTPADLVIGQNDFESISTGTSASQFYAPVAAACENGRLAISELANSRVLIWNRFPTRNGQEADLVLGQGSFTTVEIATSATRFQGVGSVQWEKGALWVSDFAGGRVLGFANPVENGQAADWVIGQPNFTSSSILGPSQTSLGITGFVSFSGSRMYIGDPAGNRIVYVNSSPRGIGLPFDGVLGQVDFTSSLRNRGSASIGVDTLSAPHLVTAYAGKLFIADTDNGRVLIVSEP